MTQSPLYLVLDSLLRIAALVRKELLATLKDPRGRLSLFVPPVMQSLIFGYAASYDLNHVPYAAFDRDRSVTSHELLARFDGSGVFQRMADISRVGEIADLIDNRDVLLVIQIDRGFERELLSGRPTDIQVVADGRNSNTAGTASGYASTIVAAFNEDWRLRHADLTRAMQAVPPVRMVSRAWYNPNLETRWYMVPGMIATLTLLQTLLLTAMSVAREREQGTFDKLLVTPFSPVEIMAGKAAPSYLIGLAQCTLVLLVAQLWFRIPFAGSFLTLYLCFSAFLLAAVGIGLLISSLAENMQQAMLYTTVLLIPFILLSGLTTPIAAMPELLQDLTLANPLRHAIEIVQRIYLEGIGAGELLGSIWPLLLIAGVTLPAAAWLFRHRFA